MYSMFARSQSSHVIPSISLTTVLLLSLVIGGCVRAKSPILYPSASLNQRGNEQDGRDLEERGGPLPKGGGAMLLSMTQARFLREKIRLRTSAPSRPFCWLGEKRGGMRPEPWLLSGLVAVVFPFRGISTFRMKGEVKGVTLVVEIGLKAGEIKQRGRGTVTLEEKNGEYRVTAVAVE